jgi:hypothetical protein
VCTQKILPNIVVYHYKHQSTTTMNSKDLISIIQKAKDENVLQLDLSNKEIEELPKIIGELASHLMNTKQYN